MPWKEEAEPRRELRSEEAWVQKKRAAIFLTERGDGCGKKRRVRTAIL